MKTISSTLAFALATVNSFSSAASIPGRRGDFSKKQKPAAFYLAGDSTTAAQSAGGGGWGVGFLKTLTNGAIGTDLGYNGATTVSYVAGGDWANVIDAVTRAKADYTPYVTIQFGHNDQKSTANISLAQYSANLLELASEALSAGGIPIMVTPLSRRNFNSSNVITQDLSDQRLATLSVAATLNISYIDLNLASTNYLNSIGKANSATYNRIPSDYTHLNPTGSIVFGDMVSWLMTNGEGTKQYAKDIEAYTCPNQTVVGDIKEGVYVFPSS